MKIIKRNGTEESFDKLKIVAAIEKANLAAGAARGGKPELIPEQVAAIAAIIENQARSCQRALTVEEIQEMVETQLMRHCAYETAKKYIRYRYTRGIARAANTTDDLILNLIGGSIDDGQGAVGQENEAVKDHGDNTMVNSIQRDYIAGTISKDLTERILLPEDVVSAHRQGAIHFHDSAYFVQHMHNSTLIDLEDMLQNGTVISETMIWKCHSFTNACNIATQIIAQVASNQYGGLAISVTHLVPFVEISRQNIKKDVTEEFDMAGVKVAPEIIDRAVESRLHEEIRRGVQTLQYQVVTLLTTNGKPPFITFYLYLDEAADEKDKKDLSLIIEEMLKQRLTGIKNEAGVWVDPLYPSFVYVLSEDNAKEGAPYYYLTQLSAQCTAKRQTPDYISDKLLSSLVYGSFDQGMVTLNLADAAFADGVEENGAFDASDFFKALDQRMSLCHKALLLRHKRLEGTLSDAAPILWQHGAIARLKKGETIDGLLRSDRATLTLGYAGLWECVYRLTGRKLTDPAGEKLGVAIMDYMQKKLQTWEKEDGLRFVLYGTEPDTVSMHFAKSMQKNYGIVPGVTDKNYISTSYFVRPSEKIHSLKKLELENRFRQRFGKGALTEVQVEGIQQDQEKVLQIIRDVYEKGMEVRLTGKGDYCRVCGYEGPISLINDEDEKLVWQCPVCGNRDRAKLSLSTEIGGFSAVSE